MDYTVQGILQARILEWVAVPFSRDLPNPGIEPRSPTLQADSLLTEPPGKPFHHYNQVLINWFCYTEGKWTQVQSGNSLSCGIEVAGGRGKGDIINVLHRCFWVTYKDFIRILRIAVRET